MIEHYDNLRRMADERERNLRKRIAALEAELARAKPVLEACKIECKTNHHIGCAVWGKCSLCQAMAVLALAPDAKGGG